MDDWIKKTVWGGDSGHTDAEKPGGANRQTKKNITVKEFPGHTKGCPWGRGRAGQQKTKRQRETPRIWAAPVSKKNQLLSRGGGVLRGAMMGIAMQILGGLGFFPCVR